VIFQTFLASSLDLGFRRPVVPTLKDGVVVQLSSHASFSASLLGLNFETSPLRNKFQNWYKNFANDVFYMEIHKVYFCYPAPEISKEPVWKDNSGN